MKLFPGEAVPLEGPTGSGKTLLLRALAALDAPDEEEELVLLGRTDGTLATAPPGRIPDRVLHLAPADGERPRVIGHSPAQVRAQRSVGAGNADAESDAEVHEGFRRPLPPDVGGAQTAGHAHGHDRRCEPPHDFQSPAHQRPVNMTNSLNTPIEAREHAGAAIRGAPGTGGASAGGHGVVREIELLAPGRITILSDRRTHAPYGLEGGEPGATGRNTLIEPDGSECELPG